MIVSREQYCDTPFQSLVISFETSTLLAYNTTVQLKLLRHDVDSEFASAS